jgi:hypothetical protein
VFLLAAVRIEPAPTDLLFAVVITVGVATGRVNFRRIPVGAAFLVWAFLTLNLVAAIGVADPARAASFFAITLYVVIFGLWLASYVTSSDARGVSPAHMSSPPSRPQSCRRSPCSSRTREVTCSRGSAGRKVFSRIRTCSDRSSFRPR